MNTKLLTVLKDKGSLSAYALNKEGHYAFLIYFKEKQFWAASVDKKLYLHPDFEEDHANIMEIVSYIADHYGIKRVPLNEASNYFDKFSQNELSLLPNPKDFLPVKLSVASTYLKSVGFKTEGLFNTLETTIVERDYSDILTASAEARFAKTHISDVLKKRKITLKANDKHILTAKAIKSGKVSLVYLVGPAGTGKTVLTYLFSDYCGAPLLTFQGSEGVEKGEIIGESDVNTDEGATTQFKVVIGPLLKSYVEGYQAVIDESNFIIPGVMSVINSMVDDTPTLTFKGKTYVKNRNFVLYLTSNQGFEGTYLYNPATKTRGVVIEIPKLSAEVFSERVVQYSDEKLSVTFVKLLYKLGDKIQDFANKWGENASVCIRQALAFTDLILLKPVSFEEFIYSFEIAYVHGALNMDNDNSKKVHSLMEGTELRADLSKLYELYDYRIMEEVEPSILYDDFFSQEFAQELSPNISDADFESEFDNLFDE